MKEATSLGFFSVILSNKAAEASQILEKPKPPTANDLPDLIQRRAQQKLNQKKITHLFKDERGVLIDVKSVFKLGQFSNSKIRHWRL